MHAVHAGAGDAFGQGTWVKYVITSVECFKATYPKTSVKYVIQDGTWVKYVTSVECFKGNISKDLG